MSLASQLALLLGVVLVLTTPSLADYPKSSSSNVGSHVPSAHGGGFKPSPIKKPLPPNLIHKPQAAQKPPPKSKPPQHKSPASESETVKSPNKKRLPPKPIHKPQPVQKPPQKVKPQTSPLKTVKPPQHEPQALQHETFKSSSKKRLPPKPIPKPPAVQKPPTKVKPATLQAKTLKSPLQHKPQTLHSETLKSPSKPPRKNPLPPNKQINKQKPPSKVVKPPQHKPPTFPRPFVKPPSEKSPTLPQRVVKPAPSSKGRNPGHPLVKKTEGLQKLILKKKPHQTS